MRRVLAIGINAGAVALSAAPAAGQGATRAPRDIGPVVATAPMTFASARPQLVALTDGRVLVADAITRVVVVLDSTLRNPQVVLDSASGKANTFSPGSFLTTFRADSTLFYDRGAGALVVIAPNGTLVRTLSPPSRGRAAPPPGSALASLVGDRPPVAGFMPGTSMPVTSPSLGLIFRWPAPTPPAPHVIDGQRDTVIRVEDSSLVVRMDVTTRQLDTLARLSTGSGAVRRYHLGGVSVSSGPALFPFIDDAVVMADGSLALFSAREYRIDWINVDGSRTSGKRLPYQWQHITDDLRAHIVDSVNAQRRREFDSTVAQRLADSLRTGSAPTTLVDAFGPNGAHKQMMMADPPPRLQSLAMAEEVPDYLPPVGREAVLADRDNHVWIHPLPDGSATLDAVWDVVDRAGDLVDRVRITGGRTIVGFGPGGIVYLGVHDAGATTLQKVRWR